MGRRAPEFRRPARRRLSNWIWWILGLFMAGGLVLFVLHHHHQDHSVLQVKTWGLCPRATSENTGRPLTRYGKILNTRRQGGSRDPYGLRRIPASDPGEITFVVGEICLTEVENSYPFNR
ncbi:putative galacturonosyltransferase 11 [Platanthera guangdongensis]|uniref:Galacturonosyltransferase 11 n=1 Tax=Platanthera guangdongensis TaxID=2320717 RepID=A0ABR2M521_9ASPA